MSRRQERKRIRGLGAGPYEAVIDDLLAALASDYEDIRLVAVEALDELDDPRTIHPLSRVLRDTDEDLFVRRAAVFALADFGPSTRPLIAATARELPRDLRAEARALLRRG